MLFEGLDRIKRSAVMTTIVLMLVGNILLVLPADILPYFNDLTAFFLLVFAVVSVFNFLGSKKALIHYIRLTVGLLGGMIGIFFLVFEDLLVRVLMLLVFLFPVISGIYGIYHALVFARRSGRSGWWILVVMSVALIIFGIFVFVNPWTDSIYGTMKIVGGTLMYTAIISGLRLIWLWPIHKSNGGRHA